MAPPQTLPANFSGWDAAPATLPKDFNQWDDTSSDKPGFIGQFVNNIHTAATEPINTPLNSYGNATQFGLEHVRQGVAQAIEGTAHMLAHPIDTAKQMGLVPTED